MQVSTTPTAELHDALGQQVSAGTIDGFLWLNEDDLANHKATYSARDVADFQTNAAVRSALRTALVKQYLAQKGMTGPQVETLLTPVVLRTVHITKGHEGASGMTVFLTGFIMVMLLYVNVLVYGMSVMRSIIEEKNSRILEVLLSSVTAKELLAGKILGVGAVGLTQILIWLVIGALFSTPGMVAAKAYLSNVHIAVSAIAWFGVFFLLGCLQARISEWPEFPRMLARRLPLQRIGSKAGFRPASAWPAASARPPKRCEWRFLFRAPPLEPARDSPHWRTR